MEAEELYLKLVDKGMLVQIIKNARLKKRNTRHLRSNVIVPGYSMNPEKAPINLLISSIKKNIDISEIIRDTYSKKAEELNLLPWVC